MCKLTTRHYFSTKGERRDISRGRSPNPVSIFVLTTTRQIDTTSFRNISVNNMMELWKASSACSGAAITELRFG